jgi:hypothetical protein
MPPERRSTTESEGGPERFQAGLPQGQHAVYA